MERTQKIIVDGKDYGNIAIAEKPLMCKQHNLIVDAGSDAKRAFVALTDGCGKTPLQLSIKIIDQDGTPFYHAMPQQLTITAADRETVQQLRDALSFALAQL